MRSVPLPFLSKITLLWTRAREPGPVSPVKVDSPLPFPWTQRGEIYNFPLGGPPGGSVLPVAHSLCPNVEAVHSGQSGDQPQGGEHGRPSDHQLHDWLQTINSLLVLSDSPSRKEKRVRIFRPVENPKPDFFSPTCFLAYR